MNSVIHRSELDTGNSDDAADAIRRLRKIEEIVKQSYVPSHRDGRTIDRNLWTRSLDALLVAARHYVPPLHWLWVSVVALGFFFYAHLTALTIRLTSVGERRWPDIPSPCVLVMWHGCANSWLVAAARRQPRSQMAIMIARDPRGDCLALFCWMLGLYVVRGESGERGWEALAELASEIAGGACAVITADGGGPARIAKFGALALSTATGAPLVPIGVDCRPAIYEPHKWDHVRTPLPFSRVVIGIGQPFIYSPLADFASLEMARRRLQDALNEVTRTTQQTVRMRANN